MGAEAGCRKEQGTCHQSVFDGQAPSGEVSRYNTRYLRVYTVEGEERQYTAFFKHPATPPLYLSLYYLDDPEKPFSCEEYHYQNHKALILFPVIFLPWILAGIALVLLGVDLSGF